MLFHQLEFIIFFLISFCLYWTMSSSQARKYFLTIASFIFYGFWDYRFTLLLFGVTCITYYTGKSFTLTQNIKLKKRYLSIGISFLLFILCIFKYFNFFIDNFIVFCNLFDINVKHDSFIKIILPVGISFYVFHGISYLVDLYRKKIDSNHTLLDIALYIAFFPQLIAGPIVRASVFLPQLKTKRTLTFDSITKGLLLFFIGLMYKSVLSEMVSSQIDPIFANPKDWNQLSKFYAAIFYYMQIYFDFAGYSNMAIGVSYLFGFKLPENFNFPYISINITEFWKRWHISLSSWLRDYLYFSLGGNRTTFNRMLLNLLITMLLGGLWHGASWNFVLWGAMHGLALIIHKLFQRYFGYFKINFIIAWMLTQFWVCLLWIPFRIENFSSTVDFLQSIFFNIDSGSGSIQLMSFIPVIFIFLDSIIGIISKRNFGHSVKNAIWGVVYGVIFGLCILCMQLDTSPFIYFQF
jgi:alginate O-acetyltransferase complex protein AlgI